MEPTRILEIRKLSPKYRDALVRILEEHDWKTFMTSIPEILQKDNFECKIEEQKHNLPRYNQEHIRIIEQASKKSGRACCDILFDEWGSSGRVRPCLGHLYYLLRKLEIFQAADYIATLLKEDLPQRPADGPAARIELKLDELQIIENEPTENTSEIIHNLPYPENLTDELSNSALLPNLSILNGETNSESLPFIPRVLDSLITSDTESSEPPEDEYTSMRKLVVEGTIEDPFPDIQRSRNTGPGVTLSLNTPLRHFAYADLKTATNNFDMIPVTNYSVTAENTTEGRFLGSGGNGSVYLAFGLPHESVAAVKKIALEKSLQEHILKSFKREVETVYKFKHDNLVALLGYSCDGPSICLVYEYIAGGTLKNQLADKNVELHWKDRIHIALGISNAVTYLHTAYPKEPLIHRDIKTANILLDGMNKPKLCDYGTARLKSKHTTSHTMVVQGTGPYMAPEGNRGDVSVKLDTFSFGVVLLELLTGMAPIDETRSSYDLVTYVRELLSKNGDDISTALDKRAGDWQSNGVHFGLQLYKICKKCVADSKTDRPFMVNVKDFLEVLLDKLKDQADTLRHFSYDEIKQATHNFDKNNLLGNNFETIDSVYADISELEYFAEGLFAEPVVAKTIATNGQTIASQGFYLNSFKSEVEKLSKLKHENLVGIFGYSCEYPNYYILYEHVEGDNLQNRLKDTESPIIWSERVHIALSISRALVYLHTITPNKPVVHRSVKTANIMMDCNNKPKLRIEALCKTNTSKTLTSTISSPNAYMSPEGARGDISVKVDTFAFGIVLLELLTGFEPFDKTRSSFDILTYIGDRLTEDGNDVTSLLDHKAGDWQSSSLNVGEQLYKITSDCVKDKPNRPLMVAVNEQIEVIWDNMQHGDDESFRPALSFLMAS